MTTRTFSTSLTLLLLLAGSPALAAEPDGPGLGALLNFDLGLNHGGAWGTSLHLEKHFAPSTALRFSLIYGSYGSYESDLGGSESWEWIGGGDLLVATAGVRQVLFDADALQPWLAAGLGYGGFWFDEDDLANGYLGIDSGRLAWYAEAGFDLLNNGLGMTLSLRVLSSPVGLLWTPSFAFFFTR